MRVNTNSTATGIFNAGTVDAVTSTGTVNSTGRISLSASFDNLAGGHATMAVTGNITGNTASGQLHLVDNDGPQDGTFTAIIGGASIARSSAAPAQASTKKVGAKIK